MDGNKDRMVSRAEFLTQMGKLWDMRTNQPRSGSYPVAGSPDSGGGGPMMGAMRSLM